MSSTAARADARLFAHYRLGAWKGGAFSPMQDAHRPPDRPNPRTAGRSYDYRAGIRISRPQPRGETVSLPNDGPPPGHVESVAAAGSTTEYGQTGTRIGRALVKSDPDAASVFANATETLRPPSLVAANDNRISPEGDQDNPGVGLETRQSIKPSEAALLRALGDGLRPRVIVAKDGTVHRFSGGIRFVSVKRKGERKSRGEFIEIGGSLGRLFFGVQFFRGKLIAYSDSKGRKRKPWVDTTRGTRSIVEDDSHTAAHIEDEPNVPARILGLGGTREVPRAGRWGDAPCGMPHAPTTRALAAQKVLAQAYAKRPNAPVTVCAPGIAFRYGLLTGVSEMKGCGDSRATAPAHHALAELDRQANGDDLRTRLTPRTARVLEAVAANDSYRDIGVAEGYAPASAHVSGRRAVKSAAAEIKIALAA